MKNQVYSRGGPTTDCESLYAHTKLLTITDMDSWTPLEYL